MNQPGLTSRVAPAKVNLTLRITGRRSDGYHLLNSVVVFTDFGDRVSVNSRQDSRITLQVTGPFASDVPKDESNLVIRAAKALRVNLPLGADIELEKNLPVAAGIGGGSSDAAAALHLLNRQWGLDLSSDALARLALPLGADLPVCLAAAPTFMSGIGDVLHPVAAMPDFGILLVNDGTECPTGPVFKARAAEFSPERPLPDIQGGRNAWLGYLAEDRNDLTEPALRLFPGIAETLNQVRQLPGALLTRMSGSGATIFALFETAGDARAAARQLHDTPHLWSLGGAIKTV